TTAGAVLGGGGRMMKWPVSLAVLIGAQWAAPAAAQVPLNDGVALNIGIDCQWQANCMAKQRRAMKRSLEFVRNQRPAEWRIHLCNHNAARNRYRVDWIGFDNCIRNVALRPLPMHPIGRRGRRFI